MSDDLLLDIARCPVVQGCIADGNDDHPCSTIVQLQGSKSRATHQVPEPWSGRITEAPILFVSSNPSISDHEIFPTGDWSDEHIIDFFNNRFGGGRNDWIKNGTKGLRTDGTYGTATMFWAGIRQRAIELLQRDVKPGIDYALTEIVHCKSKSERGVAEAREHCTDRYLGRVLSISRACIFVVLGARAKAAIQAEFDILGDAGMYGPVEIYGQKRIIAFLPHPNARMHRTFKKCFSEKELRIMRTFLRVKDI